MDQKDQEEFHEFLKDEIEEIKKYHEGQMKKGESYDDSALEWIKRNAKGWREK